MHQSEANEYIDMANTYYQQQEYQEAIKYYKKALNHFKDIKKVKTEKEKDTVSPASHSTMKN